MFRMYFMFFLALRVSYAGPISRFGANNPFLFYNTPFVSRQTSQGNLYKTNITHNISTELNIDHEVSLEPVKSSGAIEENKNTNLYSKFHVGENQPGQFQSIPFSLQLPSVLPSRYTPQTSPSGISQSPEVLEPQQPQLLTVQDANNDSKLYLKSFRKMMGNSTLYIILQPIITTPIQLHLNIPYETNWEPQSIYGMNLPQDVHKQTVHKERGIPKFGVLLPPRLNYDYSASLPSLSTERSFYDSLIF